MENAFTYFCNGACCMFFVYEAFFYFLRRKQQRFFRTCACIMAFWALLFLKDPFYPILKHNQAVYNLMMLIDMSALFTCSFYSIELLSPRHVTWKVFGIHTAPYLTALAVYILCPEQWAFNTTICIMGIYCSIVLTFLIKLTKRHKKTVTDNFSDTTPSEIKWMWQAVTLFLSLLTAWIFICYHQSPLTDTFYYLFILIVWGLVSYNTRRQEKLLTEVRALMSEDIAQEKPDKQCAPNFDKEVEELFHRRKLHRDPHLTLARVATLAGTNRNYFSYYLNNSLRLNFHDFINGFRLEDAEQLMSDPECTLTQEAVAQEVGFNSLSTFRRTFFKKHGMTPNQFRKGGGRNVRRLVK